MRVCVFVDEDVCTLADNPDIGDDGLTAVAEGLQSISTLTDVDVSCTSAWLVVSMDCTLSC